MHSRQTHYLHAMGIRVWKARGEALEEPVGLPVPQAPSTAPVESLPADAVAATSRPDLALAQYDWEQLREAVAQCHSCAELVANRSQTVFGVGDTQADWLVIGEAPGADEDRQGEPFVGRAGQLLNAMLLSIGLRREQVYIANILKCRPPNNRDPLPAEAQACVAFLQRQIELLQPRIILVVGRIAAQNLLHTDTPIGKLRGKIHVCPGTDIPVVVTYHPAYLLRSPGEKAKAWDDLCLARQTACHQAGE